MGTEEIGDIKRKERSEPAREEERGEVEGARRLGMTGCEGLRLRFRQ